MFPLHGERDSCGCVNRSEILWLPLSFPLMSSALISPSLHAAGEEGKLMKSPASSMPVVKHFP